MAYGFGTTGFSLEEQVYAKLCHCSMVHLAEAVVRTESHILLAGEVFYLEEFPRASGLLCPTETCWTFWQKQRAVAIKRSLISSN